MSRGQKRQVRRSQFQPVMSPGARRGHVGGRGSLTPSGLWRPVSPTGGVWVGRGAEVCERPAPPWSGPSACSAGTPRQCTCHPLHGGTWGSCAASSLYLPGLSTRLPPPVRSRSKHRSRRPSTTRCRGEGLNTAAPGKPRVRVWGPGMEPPRLPAQRAFASPSHSPCFVSFSTK